MTTSKDALLIFINKIELALNEIKMFLKEEDIKEKGEEYEASEEKK